MSVTDTTHEFEALLEFLKANRGFDFTGYKRATLQRRFHKRMAAVGIESYAEYLDLLQAEPDEFTQLFNTLLINVTRFFRDDATWQYVAETIVPMLLERRSGDTPLRVWSAGCASGEEAYTLAMILAEAIGLDAFRERVKIYATDVDDDALAIARNATYTEKQLQDVPAEIRDKYFEPVDGGGPRVFRKDLRRSVIFGRNDLVQDAPISRIDLLVCRNTLMYFNARTQSAILGRFHYALADGGVLLLGRAESLLTHTNAFAPIDMKRRVFGKVPRPSRRERMAMPIPSGDGALSAPSVHLHAVAFETSAEAQVVIDRQGMLTLANERARHIFGLTDRDLGRPIQDLEISYRPVELRSLIEQSYSEVRTVIVRDIVWRPRGALDERWMDLEITPLRDGAVATLGVSALFTDVTLSKRLQQELEISRQNLEAAFEELQSTNEELETTNEELQSTVEELETTNEELQSTNEELETMNEELQSTNEELQTINDELRDRGTQLNDLNAFLEGIFTGLRGGVVVVGSDLRVLIWNSRSEDLWGLRAAEVVGSSLLALDIGLPVEQLTGTLRTVLAGHNAVVEVDLLATNRRGRAMQCHVVCTPLLTAERTVRGVILLMEEAR
jgi:two-component system, chemotaxis family, CheB/CheR fusion protein